MALIAVLLSSSCQAAPQAAVAPVVPVSPPTPTSIRLPIQFVRSPPRPDFTLQVLIPLQESQREAAAKKAAQDAQAAVEAARIAETAKEAQLAHPYEKPRYAASTQSGELIVGTLGYSSAFGNCVNEVKAIGKNQPGNPISWTATTQTPAIGEAALFYSNHVARITGLWSNGDIEVAQQNSPGAPHRYPRYMLRGFF